VGRAEQGDLERHAVTVTIPGRLCGRLAAVTNTRRQCNEPDREPSDEGMISEATVE
jgi:hypothetical protein